MNGGPRPQTWPTGGMRVPLLLVAAGVAACAACDAARDDDAVVTATVVDSTGQPVPGAHAELRTLNDSGSVATADSAARVRLELRAAGPGTAMFAPGRTAPWQDRVNAPLLLGPEEVDLHVRLGGDSAGVVYPADAPVMARWGRAVALRRALEDRYFAAYDACVQAGQEGKLDPGLAPLVDSVNALLGPERDPEVRAALWAAVVRAGALG